MRAILVLFIVAAILCGCNGKLITKSLKVDDVTSDVNTLEGIVFYPTAVFVEISYTTIRVDAKGDVVGRAIDKECEPVRGERLVVRADYRHPKLLSYVPASLESYKLGAELNADGTLKSVNVESSPDRGETLKNVVGAILPIFAPAVRAGIPPCNEGAAVRALERYSSPP